MEVPVREDMSREECVQVKRKKKEQMSDIVGHERVRWIEMSGG